MKKIKATKPIVLKKGKELFGNSSKFTLWLNTDNIAMNCKPIDLWETKKGLQMIYDELIKISHIEC